MLSILEVGSRGARMRLGADSEVRAQAAKAPRWWRHAFLAAMALFAMCYLGLAISIWPMVVPYTISLWAAASATKSQGFLALGTVFLLPIIVMYPGWSYWVFRGKAKAEAGYH